MAPGFRGRGPERPPTFSKLLHINIHVRAPVFRFGPPSFKERGPEVPPRKYRVSSPVILSISFSLSFDHDHYNIVYIFFQLNSECIYLSELAKPAHHNLKVHKQGHLLEIQCLI